MPSISELLNNLPNFAYYYGGYGNFIQNKLPYGDDEPGGGDSGQPFIKPKVGSTWSPGNITDDGIMPMGIIGATNISLTDVQRITKFFATPKGAIFLARQVGLQLSNPQLEQKANNPDVPQTTGNFFSDAVTLPARISNDIGTTRVYNLGLNTLAQVGTVAFGTHFYRHGLSPTMDDSDKYINIVSANNNVNAGAISGSSGNRLLKLESQLFDSANTIISKYKGGPGSFYGIGDTTINRSIDTIGDSSATQNTNLDDFIPFKISDLAKISQTGILVVNSPNQANPTLPSNASLTPAGSDNLNGTNSYDMTKTDFRLVKNVLYKTNLPFTDYTKFAMVNRIGVGNPGTPNLDRSKYWQPLTGTQDAINMLSLFYSSGPPENDSNIRDLNSGQQVAPADVRDIIKFRIESIDNDNPTHSIWMVFRAFLNGFSDSFTADWNAYKYTGRGEKFYVYDGYVRQIGLGFTIAAKSRQEMKPLYQKLNYLMSNMAPDYNVNNKMRGNIIKLTVGDYIYRQPGIINELHIDLNGDTPWEIAMDAVKKDANDEGMHEVPMVLRVSMTFIPIQDFLPRKGASTPFMSIRSNTGRDNDWLSDNGVAGNNQDSTPRRTPLQEKINALHPSNKKT